MKIAPFWFSKRLIVYLLAMALTSQLFAQVTLITPEGKKIFRFGYKTDGTPIDTNVLKKFSIPDIKKNTQPFVLNKSLVQTNLYSNGREQIYGNGYPSVNITEFYTVTNNSGYGEGYITWDIIPSSFSCLVVKNSNVPQARIAVSADGKILNRFPAEEDGRTIGLFFYSGCEGSTAQVVVTFHSYYGQGDEQIAETFLYVAGGCKAPVISTNASELCDGSTTTLQTTDGKSVYWYRDDFKFKTLLNPGVPASSIAVGYGSYYAVDPNCESQGNSNSVTIQRKELPDIPGTPSVSAGKLLLCNGESTVLTASGGNGSYVWSTGETGSSISVSAAGNYWVKSMPNTNSCGTSLYSSAASIEIATGATPSVPSTPSVSAVKTLLCNGESTTLTASGGNGTYVWSTGETGTSISVSSQGNYYVYSPGNSNSCGSSTSSGLAYVSIVTSNTPSVPSTPMVSAVKTLLCNGESTTLTASGGNGTYVWSTGETGTSISVSSQGNYYVYSPGNSNSCGSSFSSGLVYISIATSNTPSVPSTPSVSAVKTLLCNGESTVLTASGGNGTYVWSTGETGTSISVSSQGNYYVYSPGNSNSCGSSTSSGLAYVSIVTSNTPSVPPTPMVSAVKTLLCNGESTTLTASGGNGTYVWSTGETGSSIRVSGAGNYWVQSMPNTNSCGSSFSSGLVYISIATSNTPSVPSTPSVSAVKTVLCNGESTVLTASGGNGTYIWSTGETGTSISVSSQGNYYVYSPGNSNSCGSSTSSGLAYVSIVTSNTPSVPPTPMVSAVKTLLCNGESTVLTASGGNGTYVWSTGETGSSIKVSAAGNYWVQSMPNTNSCGSSFSSGLVYISIASNSLPSAPSTPTVSAGKTVLCNGETTVLTASGGNGAFVWSTGETGSSITVSTTGSYWVQSAPNTNSCGASAPSARATIDITTGIAPSAPSAPAVSAGKTLLCNGETTVLTASGGNGSYVWSTGETGSSIRVSAAGSYWVQSTPNTNGCGASAPSARAPIDITTGIAPSAPSAPAVSAGKTLLCNGETTVLTASGGNGSYVWSTGETGTSIRVSAAGSYWVQSAPNTNGCGASAPSARATIDITTGIAPSAPSAPAVSAGKTLLCNGETTVLTASGGNGSYVWSTGETGSSIRVSAAGSYWVQSAPNTNSCGSSAPSTRATIDITTDNTPSVPATPTLRAGKTVLCNGETTVLTASGGNGSYVWSTGETGSSIRVSTTGNYWVQSTPNTNSCGNSAPSAIQKIDILAVVSPEAPVITTDRVLLCPGQSASLSSTFNEGVQIVWYKQGGTEKLAESTGYNTSQPGTYYAIASVAGCNSQPSNEISLTGGTLPQMPDIIGGVSNLCVGEKRQLSASVAGGIWASSISNILAISQSGEITGVRAGTSTISYAIGNACGITTKNIVIQVNTLPTPAVITGASFMCRGTNTTYRSSVAGGVWSSSNAAIVSVNTANGVATALAEGEVELRYTVTNASGCKSTSTFNLSVITCPLKAGVITPGEVSIVAGALPGSFVLTGVSGGNNLYSYQWEVSTDSSKWVAITGATTVSYRPTAGVTKKTWYRVKVTSMDLTAYSSIATVKMLVALVAGPVTPALSNVYRNTPVPLLTVSPKGGTGAYTYEWQQSPDGKVWTTIRGAITQQYTPLRQLAVTYYRVIVRSGTQTSVSGTGVIWFSGGDCISMHHKPLRVHPKIVIDQLYSGRVWS